MSVELDGEAKWSRRYLEKNKLVRGGIKVGICGMLMKGSDGGEKGGVKSGEKEGSGEGDRMIKR